MQNEELIKLAIMAASLQVILQFFGVLKAYLEYLAVKKKGKGSDRPKRSKPKKRKPT
jgi:hypothetical protein